MGSVVRWGVGSLCLVTLVALVPDLGHGDVRTWEMKDARGKGKLGVGAQTGEPCGEPGVFLAAFALAAPGLEVSHSHIYVH